MPSRPIVITMDNDAKYGVQTGMDVRVVTNVLDVHPPHNRAITNQAHNIGPFSQSGSVNSKY